MYQYNTVSDVREEFKRLLREEEFVKDKTGVRTIEIPNASFVADEESIFGEVNWDYVTREIDWYESLSLRVEDIPGKTPEIWNKVSSKFGEINSNYGYLIWHPDNYQQYENVVETLQKDLYSRRAVMIYNRPSMHYEYNRDGMSDFVCTDAVQYLFRNEALHALVRMRSNDAVFGFKNDRAWQEFVLLELAYDLGVPIGTIFWNAGSLHVYERHFHLVE